MSNDPFQNNFNSNQYPSSQEAAGADLQKEDLQMAEDFFVENTTRTRNDASGLLSSEILLASKLNHPLERDNNLPALGISAERLRQDQEKHLPSLQLRQDVSQLGFEVQCKRAATDMLFNGRIPEQSTAFLANQLRDGGPELLSRTVQHINQNLVEMTKFHHKSEQLRLIYSNERNRQTGESLYRVTLKNQLNQYFDQKVFRR